MKTLANNDIIPTAIFIAFVLILLFTVTGSKDKLTANALLELKKPANLAKASNEVIKSPEIKTKPDISSTQTVIQQPKKRNFIADFFEKTSNIITFRKPAEIPLKSEEIIKPKEPEIIITPEINITFGDSDKGKNETVFGTCRDSERIINDTCSEIWPNVLMEAHEKRIDNSSSDNFYCTFTAIYCRNNCSNGMCLPEEPSQKIHGAIPIPLKPI